MTLEQAQQMDCPYKPRSTDLFTGQSLSKCTGSPCMCWIDTSKKSYTNIVRFYYNQKAAIDTFLETHPDYEWISDRWNFSENNMYYGKPTYLEQGYCTLRGDI